MKITVTKIVSMTSNVEATVNELSINANVRVRNNDTIEGVDSDSVNNSTAVNDFIKELEKNPSLVSTANTNEI